ncbi:2,5-diamino-6-(ribosylamino)-4(3H)-pyrimidinone 5'-phosphate reductase [Entomortierella parvispora]|uniref:2,5-diamino-6-ribosylamino-4(3H)-pyrimidinone 5'-phosphate reductase n=1 Tax=Entomortierella parvispora TaxID=205924 RepID=A0A9P3H6Y4_9FUNG|nr:2,5-diamino-6-(ribosylamino)-4(3H)-pyrimidinone 5'-phosphate reductase [Entomortierella parvispora]
MASYDFLSDISFTSAASSISPHVTLTFAQSLDGKIAGANGRQLILSGEESMKATHILRSRHDAILVGIGTILNDDPRLTVRLENEDYGPIRHPQPVILDSALRFPTTSKLLWPDSPTRPWIMTSSSGYNNVETRTQLQNRGAKIFVIDLDSQGHLSIPHVLSTLQSQSIRSLMVEGGASIITSFLESSMVHSILLTIAPIYVGQAGVSAVQRAEVTPRFENITYHPLGRDIMMVATPSSRRKSN